jgi:hypothetical protein
MKRPALVLLLAVLAVPGVRAQTREVRIDIAGGGRRTQIHCEGLSAGRLPAGAPEARQADEVVSHYTTLFAHPAVQAVTYWGLSDDGSWLGAPSGFVRADATPKPSYDALHALVKGQWWLDETPVRTDEQGRFVLDAYAGDYEVSVGDLTARCALAGGAPQVTARLVGAA